MKGMDFMKKNLTIFLVVAILAFSLVSTMTTSAAATKTFADDFSSGNLSKWSNANTDDDPNNDSPKTLFPDKTWKLISDGGSALQFDDAYDNNSFNYLTPEGVSASEFTITWDMKFLTTTDSWVGWSVLKDAKDRMNACNNVLITFRVGTNSKDPNAVVTQINRGYPGGSGLVLLSTPTKLVGTGVLSLSTSPFTTYHSYKIDYHGGVITCYIDNTEIGHLTYTSKSLPASGFMSLNSCISLANIKNVNIVYTSGATPVSSTPVSTPVSTPGSTRSAGSTTSKTTASNKTSGVTLSSKSSQNSGSALTSSGSSAIASSEDSSQISSDVLGTSSDLSTSNDSSSTPTNGGKSGNLTWLWIVIGIVVIVLAGGAVYWFIIRKKLAK
jgi:hypothetical protein